MTAPSPAAQVRTPVTAGAGPLLAPATVEPALAHALADEMVALTRSLADLAFDLATDPETLRRHMHSLQAIDRITQAQLALADLLRARQPVETGLAAVTLDDLAASLRETVSRYRREGLPVEAEIDDAA